MMPTLLNQQTGKSQEENKFSEFQSPCNLKVNGFDNNKKMSYIFQQKNFKKNKM